MKLPRDDKLEQTIPLPIPGLVAGCEQGQPSFQGWEKAEKGGALKSVFFWKGKKNEPRPVAKNKDSQQAPALAVADKKPHKIHRVNVDKTIYKILTRQSEKRLVPQEKKPRRMENAMTVTWRGPREQPSEVSLQRKIRIVSN